MRSKVTREDFEKACEDLKPGFTQPITDALRNAGLTMVCFNLHLSIPLPYFCFQRDISSVIVAGGVSRTPMVQAALRKAVGEYVDHCLDVSGLTRNL